MSNSKRLYAQNNGQISIKLSVYLKQNPLALSSVVKCQCQEVIKIKSLQVRWKRLLLRINRHRSPSVAAPNVTARKPRVASGAGGGDHAAGARRTEAPLGARCLEPSRRHSIHSLWSRPIDSLSLSLASTRVLDHSIFPCPSLAGVHLGALYDSDWQCVLALALSFSPLCVAHKCDCWRAPTPDTGNRRSKSNGCRFTQFYLVSICIVCTIKFWFILTEINN